MENLGVKEILLLLAVFFGVVVVNQLKPKKRSSKKLRGIQTYTNKGQLVRSKAEARIANTFDELNIEYQYEKIIFLDGQKLRPDFYLPKYEMYLEYFGWYNKKETYSKSANNKKSLYKKHRLKTWYLYPRDYKILEVCIRKKIFWLKFWYFWKKIFGIQSNNN